MIATNLALRYSGKQINPKYLKAPAIENIGQRGTVASMTFRRRDKGDGKEGESELHIPRLLRQ